MKRDKIPARIIKSLALPVAMYLVMMVLCFANGKMYFGTAAMWKAITGSFALAVTSAMAIGLQFSAGRFDFSGGAVMLVAVIIAGNVAKSNGSSPLLYCVLCIAICVVLSLGVALLYVFGRMPVVITTIGMALLYEAITCLIYKGGGVYLVVDMRLSPLSSFPLALIPIAIAILIFAFYTQFTVSGRQSLLLASNQQVAVNIGIKEKKNVIISFLFSGLIYGLATIIYGTMGSVEGSFTNLSTVGQLFSNVLPVFIGLMLARYCGHTIGIVIGAFTLSIMSFGLTAVFSSEMGSALSTICTSVFIILINVWDAQRDNWTAALKGLFGKNKTVKKGV